MMVLVQILYLELEITDSKIRHFDGWVSLSEQVWFFFLKCKLKLSVFPQSKNLNFKLKS